MSLTVQLQRPRKIEVRNFPGTNTGAFSIIEIGPDDGGRVQIFVSELVDLDFLQDAINQARAHLTSPEVRAAANPEPEPVPA